MDRLGALRMEAVMATKLSAMSERAIPFAVRQPRVMVGGSILSYLLLAELVAAFVRGAW